MTDFGKHFWPNLPAIRTLGSAFGLAVASIVQLFFPTYPLQPILLVLAFELAASLFILIIQRRIPSARLVHIMLWKDTAVITACVFYTGGIAGGFASLYGWIVIMAAVLVGLRWFPFYVGLALAGFALASGLDALGIHAAGVLPPPPPVLFLGQVAFLAVLIAFIYLLSTSMYGLAARLRLEERESAARREELARQSASAREKATLLAQTQKRASQLELVSLIAAHAATIQDAQQLMEQVVGMVTERFGYKSAAIMLIDSPRNELYPAAAAGLLKEEVVGSFRQPLDAGIIGYVARTGKTYLARDTTTDGHYAWLLDGTDPVGSELAVPLRRASETIGVLDLESPERDAFDASDVAAMETLADQIGASIENGRLYQDAQRRLTETQTLYEFATSLGQVLEPEALARRALDSVARLIDFDIAEVSLVDEASGIIFPLAFAGRSLSHDLAGGEFLAVLHAHSLRRGLGVIGWVSEHGESVRLGDVTRDSRYLTLSPSIRSEICVPLRVGAQVIGVINLESERYDAFDERTEQILTTFAHELAVAFVNARLYGQTKRDAEVKAALLRELSHRVKNNLAAIASLLYMALDEPPESREGILMETLGRVESMVLAHTLLTRSDHARVDLRELGRQVLDDTARQLSPPRCSIQVTVEGDPVEVSPRQLSTLALVLNELATNAVQHGLANSPCAASRKLHLRVEREGYGAKLTLEDNGAGLPDGFVLGASEGLGLNLVRTLVEKDLQGRFELERRGDRTCAIVRFLVED